MTNKPKQGRPIIGTGRKLMWNTRIDPLVLKYLRSRDNASRTLHEAIVKTAQFRKWKEQQ